MNPIPFGKHYFTDTTPANVHSMPLNTWTPTESGTSLPTILPTTKAPFHLGCPGADFAPTQKHTTQSIMHNRLPLASTFHHYPPPPNQPMPPPANIIPQFWIVSLVRASMHSNESMHHHQTWTPHHPSPNTPILPLPPKMTPNSSRSRPTLNRHPLKPPSSTHDLRPHAYHRNRRDTSHLPPPKLPIAFRLRSEN